MTKKHIIPLLTGLFLLFGLIAPGAVFAYKGVSGQIQDAFNDPWVHGAEVSIFNDATGELIAFGHVDTSGYFELDYLDFSDNPDICSIETCAVSAPAGGTPLTVYVDFQCNGAAATGNPSPCTGGNTGGIPNTMSEPYTEGGPSFLYKNYNDLDTQTGPLAISLSTASASSAEIGPAGFLGLAALLLAGGTLTMLSARRRKETSL